MRRKPLNNNPNSMHMIMENFRRSIGLRIKETKEVSKRDVNFRPKIVQAFQPFARTY